MFGRFTGTGNMALLHSAPFPSDLISLGVEGISGIWKQMKLRGIGRKRAQRIYEAAQTSVGCTTGMEAARMKLQILLEDYDAKLQQYERVMQVVENLCSRISAVAELLKIQGFPLLKTVPISTKDRQRSAGEEDRDLEQSCFGQQYLLLAKNWEFQLLHRYYTTQQNNPLQKIQSIIAICCKLLRVFYARAIKDLCIQS